MITTDFVLWYALCAAGACLGVGIIILLIDIMCECCSRADPTPVHPPPTPFPKFEYPPISNSGTEPLKTNAFVSPWWSSAESKPHPA